MIKDEIKVWYWSKTRKTEEQTRRLKKFHIYKYHPYNYTPLHICVPTPVKNINTPNKLAETVYNTAGTGNFLLKGFTHCKTSKLKIKNFTLAEIELVPTGKDTYRINHLKIRGIRHYWFWKKKDEWIDKAIEKGTVKNDKKPIRNISPQKPY